MKQDNVATRAGNAVHNAESHDIDIRTVEFASCGTMLRGLLIVPRGIKGPLPAIAMAPGLSGVKEGSIAKYADFFARGGFIVLAFDNINFGESGGEPRQEADPMLQRRGYRDAITFLGLQPQVDKERIGIWGTSYAGGHVLEVAAHDRRVKCVVSQIGAISGFEALRRAFRPNARQAVLRELNQDREQRFQGQPPRMIKAVSSDPAEPCAMPSPAAYAYFMEQARIAPTWQNSLTLRSLDLLWGLENSVFTSRITPTPLLMIVALQDELVPSDLSLAAYQQAYEPKKLVLLPGNHFSPYVEQFALTGNEARDWFTRHLIVGGSVGLN
jgi:fermentation-respiration switch protein FrsA (DUF1100 family)